jgi:hypothetical protein
MEITTLCALKLLLVGAAVLMKELGTPMLNSAQNIKIISWYVYVSQRRR